METASPEGKSKKVLTIALSALLAISLIGNAVLGFLYFKKTTDNKNLNDKCNSLSQEVKKLQSQISTTSAELKRVSTASAALNDQVTSLQNQLTACQAKSAKVKTYTAVVSYVSGVIKAHNGFDGWTDAEYQKGRSLAQATGDQNFISTIDWAWNRKDIDQMTRFTGFLNALVTGIDNALK
jgi:hypothetical protein